MRRSDFRDRLPADMRGAFDAGMAQAAADGWADEVRRYVDAYAVATGCRFDESKAAAIEHFVEEYCRHHQGRFRGEPFILAPWQREIVRALWGWQRPDGTRRFRRAAIWLPKKNGKSTLCAALALALLVADGEGAPEVYTAAVDRKQASIVHNAAAAMVRQNEHLRGITKIIDSTKTITCPLIDGRLVALSADVASHEGLNISGAIIDEIHAHHDRKLVTTLMYGGVARTQPLFISISTAGVYDPESIGWEQWEYSQRVLSGEVEDTAFYPCIYAADKDADWTDPAVWRAANPSFGEILREEDFRQDCNEALKSPPKQADFKRYRLNIWVQAADAWFSMDEWRACRCDFRVEDLHGRPAFGGMDLSAKQDLTAFSLVIPPTQEDPYYYLLSYAWLPQGTALERAQKHDAPYGLWADRGLIRLTDGDVIDYRRVREDILEICTPFKLKEINYDPFFAGEIVQEFQAAGVLMVEHRQTTMAMSPAMNAFETLVLSRELRHDGNPCFSWQLGNVTVRRDSNGNIAPDKKLNRKKIDGPVSAFMATGRAVAVGKPKKSVYEDRGVIVF